VDNSPLPTTADATVNSVTITPANVRTTDNITSTFTGANLAAGTYFDVRFRRPGAASDEVALNWQPACVRMPIPTITPRVLYPLRRLSVWCREAIGVRSAKPQKAAGEGSVFAVTSTLTRRAMRAALSQRRTSPPTLKRGMRKAPFIPSISIPIIPDISAKALVLGYHRARFRMASYQEFKFG
jgi:hypothetical protein